LPFPFGANATESEQLFVLLVTKVEGQELLTSTKSPVVLAVSPTMPGLFTPQLTVQVTVSTKVFAALTPPDFCGPNLWLAGLSVIESALAAGATIAPTAAIQTSVVRRRPLPMANESLRPGEASQSPLLGNGAMNRATRTGLRTESDRGVSTMSISDYEVGAVMATADMKRAREFYEGKLGLEPTGEPSGEGVPIVYPCGGGTTLSVYESPEHAGKSTATMAGWDVTGLEGLVDELTASGVEFERYDEGELVTNEKGIVEGDGVKVAFFRDPDGNTHSLNQA
jgi:catechol 2,3-dioxygenase-like lactoylglutathione lyase family enzyme